MHTCSLDQWLCSGEFFVIPPPATSEHPKSSGAPWEPPCNQVGPQGAGPGGPGDTGEERITFLFFPL